MTFLNGRIESAINDQLSNMKVKLGEAVLELDPKTHVPHVRFQNLVLYDETGTVIASAPRAAVAIESQGLFSGKIVARSLELIGSNISGRRNLDGSVELGVGGQATNSEDTLKSETQTTEVIDGSAKIPKQTSGTKLLAMLDLREDGASLSSLQDIRITGASVNFYDEQNAVNWFAPKADLTFQKKTNGFVVLAKADIATSKTPWHAEFSGSYNHQSKSFNVSTTIENLVPANIAEKSFAFSQFAKVNLPLSGHVELEATEAGVVTAGKAELSVAKGELTLPDYVALPIAVDEGSLFVNYRPEDGSFAISDSSIVVGGARTELTGNVLPIRQTDGKLSALNIKLKAKNSGFDGKGKTPILVDHIEFSGTAGIDSGKLEIDDFVVMSGNTGVRMRGSFASGENSPSIHLAGRVRDVSSELLKQIWPPIIAPKSRDWVNANVVQGRVSEGTFQINLAADELAKARQNRRLPDGAIQLSFSLRDVTTKFFNQMPLITGGSAEGKQTDNEFMLTFTGGQTSLDSGETIELIGGSFGVNDLLHPELIGDFHFNLEAPVQTMLAFAALPDIGVMKPDSGDLPDLQGTAHATINLNFPMIKAIPKERMLMKNDVGISDATVKDIVPGVDLTDGNFAVAISDDKIAVVGPAKLNGLPADVSWTKLRNGSLAEAEVTTTMDEATREKLGLKLKDYMSGDVPVHATIGKDEKNNTVVNVEADLSAVKMKLTPVSWKRAAVPGTKASFTIHQSPEGRSIDDLVLDGDGLHLRGNIQMTAKGKLQSVTMDQIKLDEDNVFQAKLTPGDGSFDLELTGKNFDIRPYIKAMISPVQKPAPGAPSASTGQDFTLRAKFDRITANRGEAVDNVTAVLRARAGKIAEANIDGTLLSGLPVNITVVPLPIGREMRVTTNDGGAVLRAANFYSKVAGGQLNFYVLVGNEEGSPVRKGQLELKNFEVRNEAALAELDRRGKPLKSGPRKEGVNFDRLWLPFTTDGDFVRLGNVILHSSSICGTADGLIRKSDSAIDVTGTFIPACGLSGAFNNVPILGDILSGGNSNEGLFGITYAVSGTLAAPNVKMNPLSVIAPGIFRRIFDFSPKKAPGSKSNNLGDLN